MAFSFYGPTCDDLDRMAGPFELPGDVGAGDYIEIGMLGAYGCAMRTQFNGFGVDQIGYCRGRADGEPLWSVRSRVFECREIVSLFRWRKAETAIGGEAVPRSKSMTANSRSETEPEKANLPSPRGAELLEHEMTTETLIMADETSVNDTRKDELLSTPVEHIDITKFDARPIVEAMGKMSFTSRDLSRATEIYK